MRDAERLDLALAALDDGGPGTMEAVVTDRERALTRFTRNAIHQNVVDSEVRVTLRAIVDGRTGAASTNRRDPDGIREARERAVAQARLAPRASVPPVLPTPYAYTAPSGAYDEATASASPRWRADAAAAAFAEADAADAWAAGFVTTQRAGIAVANSAGVRATFAWTEAGMNVKCIAPAASGYAEGYGRRIAALDPGRIGQAAAHKAAGAGAPAAVDPGVWTVVLEPPAVGELVSYLISHFGAQSVSEGSSFLSPGLGKPHAAEHVTIVDDFAHPLHAGQPFDREGQPTQRVVLLEHGVGAGFVTDSEWAARLQIPNTGHHAGDIPFAAGPQPRHLVLETGTRTREELVASVERGILVSRCWYIRNVDARRTIVTGMTRDGTFLIENGQIVRGVRNFRFNVSLLDVLSACELGNDLALTGSYSYRVVVPTIKAQRFTFTSVTDF